jgi:plasmid stabilization system protein ParE
MTTVIPLRFLDEALVDLHDAALYYDDRSPLVSAGFLDAVDEAKALIAAMPGAAPAWPGHPDVRRRVLAGYPFALIYMLAPGEIVIIAVEHAKRRPGYWLGRLR